MYRVLLPVDRNESRARAQADAVLEAPTVADDVAVDVLHVHSDATTTDAEWAAGSGFSETFTEEMAERIRDADRIPASVEAAADLLEAGDVEYAVHERSGEPAVEILGVASERDSDAIVLGVGGHSPVGKVLFGSVVQGVILESDRPVTVVPEETE